MTIRPRRSMLYMPGSNARAMEKARELPADAVIFDLEDAVAPDAKAAARALMSKRSRRAVSASRSARADQRPRHRLVARRSRRRRRRRRTPYWCRRFRRPSSCGSRPSARRRPRRRKVRLWAMMETPLAMLNAREIAAAALDAGHRLAGFVMGTNDLAKDTRARIVPGRAPMLPWLMNCVAAARAYGIDILDGVYNELGNAEGFARRMRAGARSRLRRQDADPSAADRALQRRVFRRARRRWHGREKSSPRSISRRTPPRACCRSTAAWSSGCMPTWRGARWRLPMRSRGA